VVFRVSRKEGERRLRYELLSREPPRPIEDPVAERIAFFLSLGDDVEWFYAIARKEDQRFHPLVERSWGPHRVKFLALLETACWALINQRMQRPIALRIKRSLTERFGECLDVDGVVHWCSPTWLAPGGHRQAAPRDDEEPESDAENPLPGFLAGRNRGGVLEDGTLREGERTAAEGQGG
jgi:hypothetical protein